MRRESYRTEEQANRAAAKWMKKGFNAYVAEWYPKIQKFVVIVE
jgi:hypothetical protein